MAANKNTVPGVKSALTLILTSPPSLPPSLPPCRWMAPVWKG